MTPAEAVKLYLHLRDTVEKELDTEYKAKKAEIDDAKEELKRFFLLTMQERGEDQIKTEFGTVFPKEETRVKVADRDAFLDFVFETGDRRFITNHVSKDAYFEYKAEYEMHSRNRPDTNLPPIPPGLEVHTFISCNVRKA